MERQHIVSTLRQVGGHRGKAAALLGIDPKTLYRKILGYQIVARRARLTRSGLIGSGVLPGRPMG